MSTSNWKFVLILIFQPGNVVHSVSIKNVLQYMKNIPNDVAIISGNNAEIETNKYLLAVFSLRNLLQNFVMMKKYQV